MSSLQPDYKIYVNLQETFLYAINSSPLDGLNPYPFPFLMKRGNIILAILIKMFLETFQTYWPSFAWKKSALSIFSTFWHRINLKLRPRIFLEKCCWLLSSIWPRDFVFKWFLARKLLIRQVTKKDDVIYGFLLSRRITGQVLTSYYAVYGSWERAPRTKG